MAEYPVINAPNIVKDAIVVEKDVMERLVAHYDIPMFVQKEGMEGKTVYFIFLPHCRTIIAYDEKAHPRKKQLRGCNNGSINRNINEVFRVCLTF
ncbi:hypothetical protein ANME2D_00414 [Candidatus Methanoperedens nitroreducens]|uniref:Uncharacterized protein n=1 Tax=Candidatus Methanoperedens nitratireducens TaxID=1392998 RepID=A0A062VA06_9EURY|nr:hypothetical protein [Candidatus Methanoperedens nitroreducens]KCZ73348.1 hypothetical protein ANME2D_00414 [Candidatus Methanoperedens nitroreducens]MDJ1422703.1 hypothetical protein [Candidatus Methanoperedens sp.]